MRRVRAQAAYFGKKVAIVERSPNPGGAVVSDAEVPSKTLRETALYVTGFRLREVYGLSLHLDSTVTLQALTGRTAEVIATASGAVQANLDRHGIELVPGHGALLADRQVRVRNLDGSNRGCWLLRRSFSRQVRLPSTRPGSHSRIRMSTIR